MPMIVIHHRQPNRKLTRAIHQPLKRNQITFIRNETAPPPYSTLLPNGQNDNAANLKHCSPYGIPIIVIHHNTPERTHAIPLIKPPNKNQQIFPNNLIVLPSLTVCFHLQTHIFLRFYLIYRCHSKILPHLLVIAQKDFYQTIIYLRS